MIINHSKQFIFFANRKTASTSTAIALSSSCNHKDVITPLGRDEKIRKELGYQGPTNFIPWWNKIDYFAIKAKAKILKKSVTRELKTIGLRTHIGVNEALTKNYIRASILEDYYSFCFIRNPWDHALSQFFELKKDKAWHSLDLDTFINDGTLEAFAASCRSIYSHEGKILVKHLYQYEKLQETIENIFKVLKLTGNPELPRAKSHLRSDKRPYRELINSSQKNKIEHIFAQEIEWGKYQF
ncbi:MAG: sulfotransferase family 2 domain-containing protein [Synechococcus sp.]|nr:sulfotransferase family 2 domain-containing protein [Synechococcus sp.]